MSQQMSQQQQWEPIRRGPCRRGGQRPPRREFTVDLTVASHRRLTERARAEGRAAAAIIREALDRHLADLETLAAD